MFSLFAKNIPRAIARRNITTSVVRRSGDPLTGHIDQLGQVGKNLPFQIQNRLRLALVFVLYFGSAFSAPFLVIRYNLLKKNS